MKKSALVLCLFLTLASVAGAGSFMWLWEPYTHQPDKTPHYAFSIRKTKFGIAWGPCGPAGMPIAWIYWFDLAGEGPVYTPATIKVRQEGDPGPFDGHAPAGGQIRVDRQKRRVFIELKVEQGGVLRDFEGNGSYAIKGKA